MQPLPACFPSPIHSTGSTPRAAIWSKISFPPFVPPARTAPRARCGHGTISRKRCLKPALAVTHQRRRLRPLNTSQNQLATIGKAQAIDASRTCFKALLQLSRTSKLDAAQRHDLSQAANALDRQASARELGEICARIMLNFSGRERAATEQRLLTNEWMEALGCQPIGVVQATYEAFRNGTDHRLEKEKGFLPSTAQVSIEAAKQAELLRGMIAYARRLAHYEVKKPRPDQSALPQEAK